MYIVHTLQGNIVIFHNRPLESQVEDNEGNITGKVAFTTPGVSDFIEIDADLEDYAGKELQYKVVNGELVNRADADILEDLKARKKQELGQKYLASIKWTDDSKVYYEKHKFINPNDTSLDAWYTDVMTYWNEARNERIANKNSIINATKTTLDSINYSPNHNKTKEEI